MDWSQQSDEYDKKVKTYEKRRLNTMPSARRNLGKSQKSKAHLQREERTRRRTKAQGKRGEIACLRIQKTLQPPYIRRIHRGTEAQETQAHVQQSHTKEQGKHRK
jgi:hypothetical protein